MFKVLVKKDKLYEEIDIKDKSQTDTNFNTLHFRPYSVRAFHIYIKTFIMHLKTKLELYFNIRNNLLIPTHSPKNNSRVVGEALPLLAHCLMPFSKAVRLPWISVFGDNQKVTFMINNLIQNLFISLNWFIITSVVIIKLFKNLFLQAMVQDQWE